MENELDIEKIPEEDRRKILKAIEDLKKGKRNAKRKLYKYVKLEKLNRYYYKELLEKYVRDKKHEFYLWGYPIQEWLPVLMFFLFIAAICILRTCIIIKSPVWIVVALVLLYLCAVNLYTVKIVYKRNLYNKVAWIAEKDPTGIFYATNFSLRNFKLNEYIQFEQRKQNLSEQYRIDFSNEAEKEYLSSILNAHKEYVIKQYFYGNLRATSEIYKLESLEYYFFSLYNFIYSKFCKDNLYENERENVSEHWYKQKLTEYGKVYYKLRLIMELYIEANEDIQKLYKYFSKDSDYIMEIIEKNEEKFYK